jgi:hypothetical protein
MGKTVTRLQRTVASVHRDLGKLANKLGMRTAKGRKKSSSRKKKSAAKAAAPTM